jgi:hypothetical protein
MVPPRPRPDLIYPALPDPEDLHPHPHPHPAHRAQAHSSHPNVQTSTTELSPGHTGAGLNTPVDRGGLSLRGDEYQWPESGPSGSRIEEDEEEAVASPAGGKAKVGPFGAKLVAAMTGAMTTSLLSESRDRLGLGYE